MPLRDILYRVMLSYITHISILAFCVILHLLMYSIQEQKIPEQHCIPCSLFRTHGLDAETNPLFSQVNITTTKKAGVLLCCFKNFDQVIELGALRRRLDRIKEKESFKQVPKEIPGHLTSVKKKLLPPLDDESVVRFSLTNDDKVTEHFVNRIVQEKAIVVVRPGTYFVYMSLEVKPNSDCPGDTVKYQVSVFSKETNIPSILISESVDAKESVGTNYKDGLFRLEAEDRIQVTIKPHCMVVYKRESSFIGVTLIPDSGGR